MRCLGLGIMGRGLRVFWRKGEVSLSNLFGSRRCLPIVGYWLMLICVCRPAKFEGQMERDAPAAWPWWEPVNVGNRPIAENRNLKPKL